LAGFVDESVYVTAMARKRNVEQNVYTKTAVYDPYMAGARG
jgi:hypothetical protein